MMDEEPEEREPLLPPLTPGIAFILTFAAGGGTLAAWQILLGVTGHLSLAVIGMATILAYGAALALALPRVAAPPGVGLGLVSAPRAAWFAAVALIAAAVLTSEVDNITKVFFPPPEVASEPPNSVLEALVVLALVRPIAQELLFRGVIQPVLTRDLGPVRGVAYTALLNTLGLMLAFPIPWAALPTFLGGLVLGVLRHTSGSLRPGLFLHVSWGLITVAATYGAFGIPGFDDTSEPHTPLFWLALAAGLTGVGFQLCRRASTTRAFDPAAPPPEPED